MGLTKEDFAKALQRKMREAASLGADYLDVNAGDLHRDVGVYPRPNHSMPTCCSAMRAAMRPDDVVLSEPPKGNGASLLVRYRLPRR